MQCSRFHIPRHANTHQSSRHARAVAKCFHPDGVRAKFRPFRQTADTVDITKPGIATVARAAGQRGFTGFPNGPYGNAARNIPHAGTGCQGKPESPFGGAKTRTWRFSPHEKGPKERFPRHFIFSFAILFCQYFLPPAHARRPHGQHHGRPRFRPRHSAVRPADGHGRANHAKPACGKRATPAAATPTMAHTPTHIAEPSQNP